MQQLYPFPKINIKYIYEKKNANYVCNPNLKNRNVLILFQYRPQSVQWELLGIDGKGFIGAKVIHIVPYSIKGNIVFLKVCYYVFEGCDILVTPSRLMIAEGPKGRN